MANITVRNLDDDVKARLRIRAAENHRSMLEEIRIILRDAVNLEIWQNSPASVLPQWVE